MRKIIFTLIFTLTNLLITHAFAQDDNWQNYSYKVIRVKDGDTIEITDGNLKFAVRMATIDAPEKAQPFGSVAKSKLQELLLNKNVQIKPLGSGVEKYGRILGQVFLDHTDIALLMIESGLATYYRPTCSDFPDGDLPPITSTEPS